MPKKQSTSKVSTLAAKVLSGKKPTTNEAKTLAASVLSQDEKKGQGHLDFALFRIDGPLLDIELSGGPSTHMDDNQ